MPCDPFLALVERALADGDFLGELGRHPEPALAAAGLKLAKDDLAALRAAVAACGADPQALVAALVAAARQRDASAGATAAPTTDGE